MQEISPWGRRRSGTRIGARGQWPVIGRPAAAEERRAGPTLKAIFGFEIFRSMGVAVGANLRFALL